MDNRLFIFLGFFAAGVAVIAITVGMSTLMPVYKVLFLIVAIFFSCLALSVRWYYYLMGPIISQRKRDVVLSSDYGYACSEKAQEYEESVIHLSHLAFVLPFLSLLSFLSFLSLPSFPSLLSFLSSLYIVGKLYIHDSHQLQECPHLAHACRGAYETRHLRYERIRYSYSQYRIENQL